MFKYKEKNGIYLQYLECSPLQKIQRKAKCATLLQVVFHFNC